MELQVQAGQMVLQELREHQDLQDLQVRLGLGELQELQVRLE